MNIHSKSLSNNDKRNFSGDRLLMSDELCNSLVGFLLAINKVPYSDLVCHVRWESCTKVDHKLIE